jgi:flagellar basal body rod protein FlgC
MIRALETALAGYGACSDAVARSAGKMSSQSANIDETKELVSVMVNQRAAEANLAVARVAEDTGETLMHVIA